jgi:hypothetical protein
MNDELKEVVRSFFNDYLDLQEESDNGKIFNPVTISCCRVLKTEGLNEVINKMRELSK